MKQVTRHCDRCGRNILEGGSTRRYLAACRALAVVQRLNLPNIQVNIAGNQVVANG